jgi:hypothetical protein
MVTGIAIRAESVEIAGVAGTGMTLNGTIPGPLVELYEGTRPCCA